jgi:hypothetical protein
MRITQRIKEVEELLKKDIKLYNAEYAHDKQVPKSSKRNFSNRAHVLQVNNKMHVKQMGLAQEMPYDLEMNSNKIAPFGEESTAKELHDHAAKS